MQKNFYKINDNRWIEDDDSSSLNDMFETSDFEGIFSIIIILFFLAVFLIPHFGENCIDWFFEAFFYIVDPTGTKYPPYPG
jgi:hypothetical protein